jgi:hypothetical protein
MLSPFFAAPPHFFFVLRLHQKIAQNRSSSVLRAENAKHITQSDFLP